ncbi:hypothetical protein [Arsenicicoccus piscis]|uniref:Uncharacterized protein n=1 Tax=Arsenicicoccus piscis TaxID=673954 RepID=A0ABQ6HMJ8_9MICO|nr:hypothetical protein GCM10025862_07300 [Arsenicicoccus piscis]
MSARGPWPLRDRPVVVWLLAAFLVSLVHRFLPESRWLMVHLVLLGAVTHSIVVWSTHFAEALLKPGPEAFPASASRVSCCWSTSAPWWCCSPCRSGSGTRPRSAAPSSPPEPSGTG